MKKIFTLLTLAASSILGMSAAVPTLLFGDKPVEAGKTYEAGYTVETQDYAGVMTFYTYTQDTDLFLVAPVGSEIEFNVKASASVSVCTFGTCNDGTDVTKKSVLTSGDLKDGKLDLDIHKSTDEMVMAGSEPVGAEGTLSEVTVTVTAWYTSSPNEKAEATVILTKKPQSEVGGIGSVAAEGTYVRLASGNILSYKVAEPTKLEIYAITGRQVISKVVSAHGTMSLDTLPAGIYIYRAGKHTGKIVVR